MKNKINESLYQLMSSASASASAIGLFVHFGLYSIVQYRHITPLQRKKFRKEGGGNGAEWLQDILRYKEGIGVLPLVGRKRRRIFVKRSGVMRRTRIFMVSSMKSIGRRSISFVSQRK